MQQSSYSNAWNLLQTDVAANAPASEEKPVTTENAESTEQPAITTQEQESATEQTAAEETQPATEPEVSTETNAAEAETNENVQDADVKETSNMEEKPADDDSKTQGLLFFLEFLLMLKALKICCSHFG